MQIHGERVVGGLRGPAPDLVFEVKRSTLIKPVAINIPCYGFNKSANARKRACEISLKVGSTHVRPQSWWKRRSNNSQELTRRVSDVRTSLQDLLRTRFWREFRKYPCSRDCVVRGLCDKPCAGESLVPQNRQECVTIRGAGALAWCERAVVHAVCSVHSCGGCRLCIDLAAERPGCDRATVSGITATAGRGHRGECD